MRDQEETITLGELAEQLKMFEGKGIANATGAAAMIIMAAAGRRRDAARLREEVASLSVAKKRARCAYCGTAKPVTGKGRIRKHWVTGGPATTTAGQRVVCGGSGRPA